MTCHDCGDHYPENDSASYDPPHYGWHPDCRHCFPCYLFALFGSLMDSLEVADAIKPQEGS